MILTEAMSAGTPVVASDLEAFSRVLDGGAAGVLTPVADAPALAAAIDGVLGDPVRRAALVSAAQRAVATYDWSLVAARIVKVYEAVIAANPRSVVEAD
jgi:phosphatidylinositol alpha-mannosyltransferase